MGECPSGTRQARMEVLRAAQQLQLMALVSRGGHKYLEGQVSKVAQENSHIEKARGSDQGPLQLRMFRDFVIDDSQATDHWALLLDEALSVFFRLVHVLKEHQSKFGLLVPKQQLQ